MNAATVVLTISGGNPYSKTALCHTPAPPPSFPGDLTLSKRTGTSKRIEIQFRTFNQLSRPDFL